MGVVLMDNNKNHFDFKDLMAFGMFILSLLTFIYLICH
nr:MAG TPA: Putative Holin-like Toxin (Hol-Tox) [Caudoviricetes sp.]